MGCSRLCSGRLLRRAFFVLVFSFHALQKERSPGLLPGFVWFRVPKLAPQLLANSGGGLELHFGVGICEVYYGDLSWGLRCGPSQQFAKQPAVTLGKRLQFAQERSKFRRAGPAEIYPSQCPVSLNLLLCSGLRLNWPVHKSSLALAVHQWTRATCPRVH